MFLRIPVVGMIAVALVGTVQGERVSVDAALHTSDKPYIQATGEATVSAMPDRSIIEIGVVTTAVTAADAASQNARQTKAVLAELAKLQSAPKVKTTRYSVGPHYQYPKPAVALTLVGYKATNIVEITLDDLTQVGPVIDRATQAGANVVQALQYEFKNSRELRGRALREAAEEAKANAESIAAGLGLRVVRVLSAEEATSDSEFGMHKRVPPPPPGPAPATPIEAGMIEVSARVTVRVEIGP